MCQKVAYNTRSDAVKDAEVIKMHMRNSRNATNVKRLKPYKCKFCTGWHLSSKNGRGKQYDR